MNKVNELIDGQLQEHYFQNSDDEDNKEKERIAKLREKLNESDDNKTGQLISSLIEEYKDDKEIKPEGSKQTEPRTSRYQTDDKLANINTDQLIQNSIKQFLNDKKNGKKRKKEHDSSDDEMPTDLPRR